MNTLPISRGEQIPEYFPYGLAALPHLYPKFLGQLLTSGKGRTGRGGTLHSHLLFPQHPHTFSVFLELSEIKNGPRSGKGWSQQNTGLLVSFGSE